MRTRPDGEHILGGLTAVHIDGILLSSRVPELVGKTHGAWDWISNTLVGGQIEAEPGKWQLWGIDLTTYTKKVLDDRNGCSVFFGGGNVWAAGLSLPDKYWYRDSYGLELNDAAPVGVDNLTGRVALVTNTQAGGPLKIWDGHGTITVWTGAIDSYLDISFRDGVLFFRAGGKLQMWEDGVTSAAPVQAHMAGGRSTKGTYVIGYKDGLGDVVYSVLSGIGLPLHAAGSPPDAYNHDENADLGMRTDGVILVGSSRGALELPQELQRYLVDFATCTVNGEARTPINVLDVPDVPAPVPPEHPRNLWRGLCSDRIVPGNVVWAGIATDQRVRFSGVPYAKVEKNVQFMLFSPKENAIYPSIDAQAADLVAEVQKLYAAGKRCCVVVYHDGRPWASDTWLTYFRNQGIVTICGMQWYPRPGWSAEDCFEEIKLDLEHMKKKGETQFAAVRAVYTQNHTWKKEDTWLLLDLGDDLIEADSSILCDFLFGDGRPGESYRDWPEVQSWYAALCAELKADAKFPVGAQDMTKLRIIGLKVPMGADGEMMVGEINDASPRPITVRTKGMSAWTRWFPHVFGNVWQDGATVILESEQAPGYYLFHDANGNAVLGTDATPMKIHAASGGWALTAPTKLGEATLTCEFGSPTGADQRRLLHFITGPRAFPYSAWNVFSAIGEDGKTITGDFK